MPTYDRECQNPACRFKAEAFERITAPRRVLCPKCRQRSFERQFSGTGHFAGARLSREIRQYPYSAWTLPLRKNPETGRMERCVVQSPSHEREVMAGSWNGERQEKGQIE